MLLIQVKSAPAARYDRLNPKDKMSEPSTEKVAEPARFERSIMINSAFAGRMAASAFRQLLLTPGRIVRIALPLLILAFFFFKPGFDGIANAGMFALFLLAVPAIYLLIFLIAYFQARKQISERLPVGSEYSISMGEHSMRLKDSLVTTDIAYQLYRSLKTSEKLVVLLPQRGRRATILPIELFTPESLEWLGARLNVGA